MGATKTPSGLRYDPHVPASTIGEDGLEIPSNLSSSLKGIATPCLMPFEPGFASMASSGHRAGAPRHHEHARNLICASMVYSVRFEMRWAGGDELPRFYCPAIRISQVVQTLSGDPPFIDEMDGTAFHRTAGIDAVAEFNRVFGMPLACASLAAAFRTFDQNVATLPQMRSTCASTGLGRIPFACVPISIHAICCYHRCR